MSYKIRTKLVIALLFFTACGMKKMRHDIGADYERARTLLGQNLQGLVTNADVSPNWIGNKDDFWYRRDAEIGGEYVIIDAKTGIRKPAFDHGRLAQTIFKLTGEDVNPDRLQVTGMSASEGSLAVTVSVEGKLVECTLEDYICTETPKIAAADPWLLTSPNGRWSAFVRDYNLWIRNLKTGAERALTTDGAEYYEYGGLRDQAKLAEKLEGEKYALPPQGAYWSPDGHKLIVPRLDERDLIPYPFLQSVHDGGFRPIVHFLKISLLGDEGVAKEDHYIFDVKSGERVKIALPDGFSFADFSIENYALGWSEDYSRAYLYMITVDAKIGRLIEINLETGDIRTIIEEIEDYSYLNIASDFLKTPNVRILSEEVVWYSERDGWGHLYLYDLASGDLKNQITSGNWVVFEIVHIDQIRRRIYFTAGGREKGRDPYYRHMYWVSLDGGEPTLLTHENADHEIVGTNTGVDLGRSNADASIFSPSGDYFVETYSTVEEPPVTVIRSSQDGRIVAEVEHADASALFAKGWRTPKRFSVKAADGSTDIYGVLFSPPRLYHARRYPILDANYINPIFTIVPKGFSDPWDTSMNLASLAELGFFVMVLDGRGTPLRSKAFRDIGYTNYADPQIEDHIAAMRQLAERDPRIDLDRVGIFGHSNGGDAAARAILKYPDSFHVAVASSGSHDYQSLPGTGMKYFGVPDYGDSKRIRPEPNAVPNNYRIHDNAAYADGLEGKLLLAYGDRDVATFPALTLRLADALIKANKSFDLLYMPNRTHRYPSELYFIRRKWDYFVEHLHGVEPPPIEDHLEKAFVPENP